MSVLFSYKEHLDEVRIKYADDVKKLVALDSEITKEQAKVVAAAVRTNLPRTTPTKAHPNGTHGVHMADDVVVSGLLKSDGGERYRTVGGGRKTATLWHLVEYGTSRNSYHGRRFIERSMDQVESQLEKIADDKIERALNND